MQTTFRGTLIVGATALFAFFAAAQAAEPYGGGVKTLRSFLNESFNEFSRAQRNGEFRGETVSVRSLVRGILKDVGGRSVRKR